MNTTNADGASTLSLPPTRQNVILAICCLSLLVVSMDATIVNVALPDIRRELGSSLSGLQWVIDAYTIVVASFLILGGSTADRFGRRRVFQVGVALFTLGSLLCSLAVGVGWLVAARVVQALGGSMMNRLRCRSSCIPSSSRRRGHAPSASGRRWRAWRWRWVHWRAGY